MRAGLGLGSNMGDRLAALRAARAAIGTLPGVRPPVLSAPIFETDPVDCEPGTPAFLNTVIEVEYDGHPVTLLDALRAIEVGLGRPSKHPRNGSRPIDLDILYVGNLTLRNEEVAIPHPRLHLRRFVLAPLAAIRPELVLPGQMNSVTEWLAGLPDDGSTRLSSESW
jgi:2-amino-4-hydroxy-6-hydroxymethyldihydropteridine diphosphokinase